MTIEKLNINAEITHLVRLMEPLDTQEQTHIKDTLSWAESGIELCRIQKPATPPKHLVSYFVVIDELKRQLLLVHHKKSGLWLPSGGHVEIGEHPTETVRREVVEELNIEAVFFVPDPLFLTVTQTVGLGARHTDVSLWYVLRGDCTTPLDYDRREFYTVQWFPMDRLPDPAMMDPHMGRFVCKLLTHMQQKSS